MNKEMEVITELARRPAKTGIEEIVDIMKRYGAMVLEDVLRTEDVG